jgi:hypothetical protein
MNSERFNRALNEISDDLIDAAAGAYEKKANRKKAVIRVAWAACAVLVLTAIGLFWKAPAGVIDPTQPTISMQNPTTAPTQPTGEDIIVHTGNVYFLSATEEGTELTPMRANMTLPVNSMLRVRSLKGMTESEIEKALEEEYAFKAEFKKKYGNSDGGRYEMCVLSKIDTKKSYQAVIQYLSGGKASLILLNATQIESFDLETMGVLNTGGGYGTYNQDVTIGEGENTVTIPKGCLRIYLFPSMTDETIKIFQENPDTPLSTLRDTFTVTINYKNGTKEIVIIDVTVDDDGQIYMTQRGDNTGV